jgi:hypothetical protein
MGFFNFFVVIFQVVGGLVLGYFTKAFFMDKPLKQLC